MYYSLAGMDIEDDESFSSDDSDIDLWDDFPGDCSDGEADQWMGCTCIYVKGRWEDICYAHTCRTHTMIDAEIEPPLIEICDERVMEEEYTACEKHLCTFQCALPPFSFDDEGYGGPYCHDVGDPLRGIEGKGHCRHNHGCEFHTGCVDRFQPCRFVQCTYPGCNPCLSHMDLCAFCHKGEELLCRFHRDCECGTPILLKDKMCANCAFVKRLFSKKRSRLHTLPTEVVELIQQFVIGGPTPEEPYLVEKINSYELFPASRSPHVSVPLDELIYTKASLDQEQLDAVLETEELTPFEGDCADYEEAFQVRRRAKRD